MKTTTHSTAPADPMPPAPPTHTPRWTADQAAAIAHTTSDVLVSAAAGSGKTAVLAERCAYLVCDAPNPCDVDELLVVTFTEATAAEMRQRIGAALHQRLASAPPQQQPRLARQIALLGRAQISTLHAFCLNLIHRHHAQLGLDPACKVIDGDEAALLRRQTIKSIFAARYDAETQADSTGQSSVADHSPSSLGRFVDDYADGNDAPLLDQVIRAHALLQSIVDPAAWQRQARQRLAEAAQLPLEQSELGRDLIALLERRIESLSVQCDQAEKIISAMDGFDKYLAILHDWHQVIQHWASTLKNSGIAALAEEAPKQTWTRLPSIANDLPGKNAAKSRMDALKKSLGKEGTLCQLLRFTPQQWQQGLADTLPFVDLFFDLVRDFSQEYARAKARQRGLDFADLERLALAALTGPDGTPSPAALECRRHYRHVLVDEYQDINDVQDAILSAVSTRTEPLGDRSTAFYVGDVKQSIYRFRLAEPRGFLERMARYQASSNGRLISLQKNFRSRPALLQAINCLFRRLMTRRDAEIEYDQSHYLHPGADWPPPSPLLFTGAPIELHLLPRDVSFAPEQPPADDEPPTPDASLPDDQDIADTETTEREALLIAQRIQQLLGSQVVDKNAAVRPIEYRDIVVLLRSTKFKAGQYASTLRQCGIPVHAADGGDFFQTAEIRDMLALLSILDNPMQDIPLAAFLRGPICRACGVETQPQQAADSESDLAAIRIAFAHESQPPPFHLAALRYARERDDALAHRLRALFEQIDQWRQLARRRPVADLLWMIYQQSGYLTYVTGLAGGRQRLANLMHLHQRALQFGRFERQGLWRFLAFMEQLQDELPEPSIASEAENVVRIMTIHSAKGLEFPVVFLADLGTHFNLSDTQGSILLERSGGIGLKVADEKLQVRYPSLAWTLLNDKIKRRTLAEELRLLYVGMTRAREHLICVATGPRQSKAAKQAAPPDAPCPSVPSSAPIITEAATPLDWLLPMIDELQQEGAFALTDWSAEQMAQWPTPRQMRPTMNPWQIARAQLQPLDPVPPPDPAAQQMIDRLTRPYAYAPFTTIAASTAVTTEKHSPAAADDSPAAIEAPLTHETGEAARRGLATHEVLRFLDFSRPCTPDDLRAQIQTMITGRRISPDDAAAVDVEDILWLIDTPQGQMLRQYAASLWRELPFTWSRPAAAHAPADPLDQQIVRGRLDVLIPTTDGLVLLDYKTDRVGGPALQSRAEQYRPQLTLYCRALEQVTGQNIHQACLLFLHARKAVPIV